MELDLLGLGLSPAKLAHGGAGQRRTGLETTAFDDEQPRLSSAATETHPPAVRRRLVGTGGDDVPAPPANKLMMASSTPPWPAQPTSTKVSVIPGAAADCFRAMFPLTPPSELAARQARVRAIAASSPPPPQGASAPAVNVFGRPPPVAAAPIVEGSSSSNPLTIIYDGSVHAFDSAPMEQAEKILFMTAKEARAAETPVFRQPVRAAAAPPSTSAAQMMMLLGLANVEDSLRPKRTLSLARFLHKRKQRLESAATATHPRVDEMPTQMDPCTAVYALDKGQPWASEDGPKGQKEHHGEEEVNTELKI